MVLDRAGVPTDQVLRVFSDGGRARLQLSPCATLADAGDALVGFDAHVAEPVQQQRFDFGDLHGSASFRRSDKGRTSSSRSIPSPAAIGALTEPSPFDASVSR